LIAAVMGCLCGRDGLTTWGGEFGRTEGPGGVGGGKLMENIVGDGCGKNEGAGCGKGGSWLQGGRKGGQFNVWGVKNQSRTIENVGKRWGLASSGAEGRFLYVEELGEDGIWGAGVPEKKLLGGGVMGGWATLRVQ